MVLAIVLTVECLGHFKNVYDDDDDVVVIHQSMHAKSYCHATKHVAKCLGQYAPTVRTKHEG